MRAFHRAAADVERRTNPTRDSKRCASCRGADDIHDGVHGADLVEVDLFHGNVMDFGLGFSQQAKRAQRNRTRSRVNWRMRYQLVNFLQRSSMFVRVLVMIITVMFVLLLALFGLSPMMGMVVAVGVRMGMSVSVVAMAMAMAVRMLVKNNVDVILPALRGQYADPGGADPAPVYSFNFDLGINSERGDSLAKQIEINSRVEQRAQHHVSTHAGKAVEISNSHKFLLLPFSFASQPHHPAVITRSLNRSGSLRDRAPQSGSRPLCPHTKSG